MRRNNKINVPCLEGQPRMLREGKRFCAKKVRADVEEMAIPTRGARFYSGTNHVLLQVVAISHCCPRYWGRAESLSLHRKQSGNPSRRRRFCAKNGVFFIAAWTPAQEKRIPCPEHPAAPSARATLQANEPFCFMIRYQGRDPSRGFSRTDPQL